MHVNASNLPPWVGCWRRERLQRPGTPADDTTVVYWLQSQHLFLDLRIPAGRPAFDGCAALEDCSVAALQWLATQEGFSGHLEVAGDLYCWHRHFDFAVESGSPGVPDLGRMTQHSPTAWREVGVYAPYAEDWTHTPYRGGLCAGAKFMFAADSGEASWRQGVVVVVDQHCMLALQRTVLPVHRDTGRHDELAALRAQLECEIAYGAFDAQQLSMRIQHASLPFREGAQLLPNAARAQADGAAPEFAFVYNHPVLMRSRVVWQRAPSSFGASS